MPRKVSDDEEMMRVAVEAWMRARWPAARIIHELNIAGGTVRLDLASVGDEELRLVEIKSRKDVLDRLPNQIKRAKECAQEVWVCIDEKHQAEFDAKAQKESGWYAIGLLVLKPDGQIVERRQATNRQPDPRRVCDLLWADEMRTHLRAANNMANMVRLTVDEYGLRHIMRKVCIALKARPFPRADAAEGKPPATRFKPSSSGPVN